MSEPHKAIHILKGFQQLHQETFNAAIKGNWCEDLEDLEQVALQTILKYQYILNVFTACSSYLMQNFLVKHHIT